MDWRAGLSRHQLSAIYSISKSIISKLFRKFLQPGGSSRTRSEGKPRETWGHEDSFIERTIQNNPTASTSYIRNQLDLKISERMIRRRALEVGLCIRRL